MFIQEIITSPRIVDGRKFVERTINSKYDKGEATITTIYMDNKPIVKQYILEGKDIIKHYWKSLNTGKVQENTLDKNLNVIA